MTQDEHFIKRMGHIAGIHETIICFLLPITFLLLTHYFMYRPLPGDAKEVKPHE